MGDEIDALIEEVIVDAYNEHEQLCESAGVLHQVL